MKFRVERDRLADAVAWSSRTLPSRPTSPNLSGLLIEAADGALSLSSFDYDVSARVDVDADVLDAGRVLVPGRLLSDIAKALPAQPVMVEIEGSRVNVTCGRSTFTLPTLNVNDYPSLPAMPESTGSLPGATFASAVSQVAVAAGRDDTLPMLTGIRIEIEGSSLTMAATDRYRLAVRDLTWDVDVPSTSSAILVPAKTLADTAKSMSAVDVVTIALASGTSGDKLIGITGDGRRTTSRLLEGDFPKYRTLLPTESSTVAVIKTSVLVEAVKRVSLVALHNTPVELAFADGELELAAGAADEAKARESMECQVDGDPIRIAFNHHYLLEGLSAVDSPVVRLSFTHSSKPAVLTGMASPDAAPNEGYRYLLMPVRLPN